MKRSAIFIAAVLALAGIVNACYYDEVIVFQGLPTNVSFKNDVAPILSSNCTITGCHDAVSAHSPSLVQENAYSALINGNYVNTIDPEKSKIYMEISAGGMPPSGPLSTNNQKIILGWIAEGAKNN